MNVLVLGTGGREHALAWGLSRDSATERVYLHPGNAGTVRTGIPTLGDVKLEPLAIAASAREKKIDLIVIGPEMLLVEGYADTLRAEGFDVVGPGAAGARLESSKVFAKEFMVRAGIPTAAFRTLDNETELFSFTPPNWPTVLKYDGLAAGKGVVIAQNTEDIHAFARRIYQDKEFGEGPHRILAEECLPGKELSYIGLCDGNAFVALASATDFKRVGENNTGANTGGMGAVSPSPLQTPELEAKIQKRIIDPILKQLAAERLEFRGVLYVGVMISPEGDPFVLEFNTRFGDPETQAIVMRWEKEMASALRATARGELAQHPPLRWRKDTAIYVVAAAEGYPAKVASGDRIDGLGAPSDSATLFFSGVKAQGDALVTGGGRVLGVGAFGASIESARASAYATLKNIRWRGQHYRKDIGIV